MVPSCAVDLTRNHPRPCLQYFIKRCLGPCVCGLTSDERYAEAARDARMFLEGRRHDLMKRSEEHTSELQSRENLVCRLLLEKKKKNRKKKHDNAVKRKHGIFADNDRISVQAAATGDKL